MARKRNGRRDHNPHGNISAAIFGVASSERLLRSTRPLAALNAMVNGDGTKATWDAISLRLNVFAHVVTGEGEAWREVSRNAMLAMVGAKARGRMTGRWGFSGPELDAVKVALLTMDEADAQLTPVGHVRAYEAARRWADKCKKNNAVAIDIFRGGGNIVL